MHRFGRNTSFFLTLNAGLLPNDDITRTEQASMIASGGFQTNIVFLVKIFPEFVLFLDISLSESARRHLVQLFFLEGQVLAMERVMFASRSFNYFLLKNE